MPDEIGWPDPADEADLDAARRKANEECPQTEAEAAEVDRRCKAAEAYRLRREKRGRDEPESRD